MVYPFESGGAVSAALRPEPGWAQPGTRGRPRGAARGGTDLRASRGPSPPSLAVSDRAGAQAPHLSEMDNPFRAKRDGPVHWLDARAATGARPARSVLPNAAPGPVAHERRHERYRWSSHSRVRSARTSGASSGIQCPTPSSRSYRNRRPRTSAFAHLAGPDDTRERGDPEGRLLPPRDDAEASYARDLVSFGRGNGGPPNRGPELRGLGVRSAPRYADRHGNANRRRKRARL
jgi:hypothetical protein